MREGRPVKSADADLANRRQWNLEIAPVKRKRVVQDSLRRRISQLLNIVFYSGTGLNLMKKDETAGG